LNEGVAELNSREERKEKEVMLTKFSMLCQFSEDTHTKVKDKFVTPQIASKEVKNCSRTYFTSRWRQSLVARVVPNY
jgi:hypothetical protein